VSAERLVADLRVLAELVDDGQPIKFLSSELLTRCADEIEQANAKCHLWKGVAERLARRIADEQSLDVYLLEQRAKDARRDD
jgi:hypothetical protein